ncbi:DNA recombination protein RmuC [Anaeromyxobacter sp. SG66]|uniref:DNA recombination protein RmuC n=1 Tax=Anaeromyxobacter sp. SG66 TaxID=2925410 RepID=UPI001F586A4F|nr:DNA recombination protein RmuC [Anaeromyxobacter sp. SG66]
MTLITVLCCLSVAGIIAVLAILPSRIAAALRSTILERLDGLDRAHDRLERTVREEISRNRDEASSATHQLRDEIRSTLKDSTDSSIRSIAAFGERLDSLTLSVEHKLGSFQSLVDSRLRQSFADTSSKLDQTRTELAESSAVLRSELGTALKHVSDSVTNQMADFTEQQKAQLDAFGDQISKLTTTNEAKLDQTRAELATASNTLRSELSNSLKNLNDSVLKQVAELAALEKGQLDGFATQLAKLTEATEKKLDQSRAELADSSRILRAELTTALKNLNDSVLKQMADLAALEQTQLEAFGTQIAKLTESNEKKLDQGRTETQQSLAQVSKESSTAVQRLTDALIKQVGDLASLERTQFEGFAVQLNRLTDSNEKRLEALRATVDERLTTLQQENSSRLEQMRATVDEKLQGTLEKRLGESFKLVSDRLEAVQRGLGEMQSLANGVGDLKRVLANVKVRGTWGEVQLGTLLEQMLSPEQFSRNVATRSNSGERVEYAIRLPGHEDGAGEVLLPIDAKFPVEDYQRLADAADRGDAAAVEECSRALELRIRACAKDIHDKYLNPPTTTDFAILFLPTEGLYAEVVRRAGLTELLQREFKVVVAGPTTLAALLNSLQMGFRTLAIQKRSSEVWQVLGAVKTEFGKFGQVIEKVDKKLQEASNTLETVATRSRAIQRKLRGVQELPAPEAEALLLSAASAVEAGEEEAQA